MEQQYQSRKNPQHAIVPIGGDFILILLNENSALPRQLLLFKREWCSLSLFGILTGIYWNKHFHVIQFAILDFRMKINLIADTAIIFTGS